jgi:hypothetical protein
MIIYDDVTCICIIMCTNIYDINHRYALHNNRGMSNFQTNQFGEALLSTGNKKPPINSNGFRLPRHFPTPKLSGFKTAGWILLQYLFLVKLLRFSRNNPTWGWVALWIITEVLTVLLGRLNLTVFLGIQDSKTHYHSSILLGSSQANVSWTATQHIQHTVEEFLGN